MFGVDVLVFTRVTEDVAGYLVGDMLLAGEGWVSKVDSVTLSAGSVGGFTEPKEKVIFLDELFHTLFPGTGNRAIHQMVRLFDWAGLLPYTVFKTDFSSKNPFLSFLPALVMHSSLLSPLGMLPSINHVRFAVGNTFLSEQVNIFWG